MLLLENKMSDTGEQGMKIIWLFRILTEYSLFRILASMCVLSEKFSLEDIEKTVYYCDNLLAA